PLAGPASRRGPWALASELSTRLRYETKRTQPAYWDGLPPACGGRGPAPTRPIAVHTRYLDIRRHRERPAIAREGGCRIPDSGPVARRERPRRRTLAASAGSLVEAVVCPSGTGSSRDSRPRTGGGSPRGGSRE